MDEKEFNKTECRHGGKCEYKNNRLQVKKQVPACVSYCMQEIIEGRL